MRQVTFNVNFNSILDTMSNEELLDLKTDIEQRLQQSAKIIGKPLDKVLLCDVLSLRAYNAFKAVDIITLADLVKHPTYELTRYRNVGAKIIKEVKALRATYNI